MQFTAKIRFARITARKLRYIVDLVRGKDYNAAEAILRTQSRRGAYFVRKALKSAFENAVHLIRERDLDVDVNKLHLVEARVDSGPIIKRWRTAPMGRGVPIKKRTSHLSLVLEQREPVPTKKERRASRKHAAKPQQVQETKVVAEKEEMKDGTKS